MKSDVFVVKTKPQYPAFPYEAPDEIRAALVSLFSMWGKDTANPFGEWIGPGARVVIKPNWVYHDNPNERTLDSLVTDTSLIKHIIDFAATGLNGHGSIIIGDAPLQSCDFPQLVKRSRIEEVVAEARRSYPGIDITIDDWRLTVLDGPAGAQKTRGVSVVADNYEIVDLGGESFLEEIVDYADKFRVTCYDPRLMAAHHRNGKHEYLITRKVFGADLMINLPKMKTHIKAGMTGALKNLVGINGHKEFLPHHILGSSEEGGDCYYKSSGLRTIHDRAYDRFWSRYSDFSGYRRRAGAIVLGALWRASRILTGDSTSAGSWYGNETIWRMTLDLNHLLYFGAQAPKGVISIVDGVIAGQGEGPLRPVSKPAGYLVGGENPAYVDAVLAILMGYNISRVPTVYHAIYHRRSRFGGPYLDSFKVRLAEGRDIKLVSYDELPNLGFVKPLHWEHAALLNPGNEAIRPQSASVQA